MWFYGLAKYCHFSFSVCKYKRIVTTNWIISAHMCVCFIFMTTDRLIPVAVLNLKKDKNVFRAISRALWSGLLRTNEVRFSVFVYTWYKYCGQLRYNFLDKLTYKTLTVSPYSDLFISFRISVYKTISRVD